MMPEWNCTLKELKKFYSSESTKDKILETNPSSYSSMTTFQDIEELLILFHKFC